jgi:hypothetical protein
MIKEWFYDNKVDDTRNEIKKFISSNFLKSIDVGAGINFWTYPEIKYVADIMPKENFGHYHGLEKVFELNLQNPDTWNEVFSYVQKEGKFDFSVCSHTLEDIVNPFEVLKFLSKISKKGFVAIPSKFDEFSFHYGRPYRGNAHHKYIFDIIDGVLHILPKLSFIEKNELFDKIVVNSQISKQLCFFWEDDIDFEIFGGNKIFLSDDTLINDYYNKLNFNNKSETYN